MLLLFNIHIAKTALNFSIKFNESFADFRVSVQRLIYVYIFLSFVNRVSKSLSAMWSCIPFYNVLKTLLQHYSVHYIRARSVTLKTNTQLRFRSSAIS